MLPGVSVPSFTFATVLHVLTDMIISFVKLLVCKSPISKSKFLCYSISSFVFLFLNPSGQAFF